MTTLRFIVVGLSISLLAQNTLFGQSVKSQFEQWAAQDSAQAQSELVKLWQNSPFSTLSTIDSYLEGSLKLVEISPTPDQAKIDQMHSMALRGATAADKAFGTVVFSEYTSAFAGWNTAQQKQFRGGQKDFRDAQTALQAGNLEAALAAGQACVDKATPLGDWWGMAMGYSAIGQANKAVGNLDESLIAYTQSRAINHQLRLGRAELASTMELVDLLQKMKRPARAHATCKQGIVLAEQLGDAATAMKLKAIQTSLSEMK